MEVTRLNFKEVFPVVSQAIKDATFLSIDAEFTGLTTRKTTNSLDSCQERYEKLYKGVKDFTVPQFGICTFSWDEEQEQYVAKPFNFYIFPKPFNKQMPDTRFLCQSSSMDFLASQGFDFNKWIHHGIPFLLPTGEGKLRRLLGGYREENKKGSDSNNSATTTPNGTKGNLNVTVPPEYEKTIEGIMKKVTDFIENPDMKSLSLPPSSPFVRRLVYTSVHSAHSSGLHLESKVDKQDKKYILVSKVTEEEKECLLNQKNDREDEEIEMAVGFSKIIRLISLSGKVVIGHNMLLDLLHTIRLFVSPLPGNLDDFKALLKSNLPRLVDTKLMASTTPLQEHFTLTHLVEMYNRTGEEPFEKPNVVLQDGFEDYQNSTKAHEAAYDAYITGVSFIAMVTHLEKLRDGHSSETQFDFAVVKPFLNKIFLFPRIEDVPYLNLDGEDIKPNRDHVFYVEFPNTWQNSDIQALFKDFGYVYVSRLDSISAFVSVAKKERAAKVLYKLDVDDVEYRIMSYNEYHSGFGDGNEEDGETSSRDRSDDISHQQTPNAKQDQESITSHQQSPPNPKQDKVSSELSKQVSASDGEMEEGEIEDSPEPPTKKLKGQHTWFDEPKDW